MGLLMASRCPDQRVYKPTIESWWECHGDAIECLEELEMKLSKLESYCSEFCVIEERRDTRIQVQLLRSRYLQYLLPKPRQSSFSNGGCFVKWTRTMEIVGNSIRQAAKERCIMDTDLLQHLKYLISEQEAKCPGNLRNGMVNVRNSRERAWLWRRRGQ